MNENYQIRYNQRKKKQGTNRKKDYRVSPSSKSALSVLLVRHTSSAPTRPRYASRSAGRACGGTTPWRRYCDTHSRTRRELPALTKLRRGGGMRGSTLELNWTVCMCVYANGWMNEWMNEWMNGEKEKEKLEGSCQRKNIFFFPAFFHKFVCELLCPPTCN